MGRINQKTLQMKIDKKLLEQQIKILALQLNKKLTKAERDAFEGLLNMLGDIATDLEGMGESILEAPRKKREFELTSSDIIALENGESIDYTGHWVLVKVGKEYEATYDGLYMHVFGSLTDLIYRENEIGYFEYNSDMSEDRGEETFCDADGNPRSYED